MGIAPIVAGIIWRLLFMPDSSFINYLLSIVRINGPQWLLSPTWAVVSITVCYVWEWTPFFIVMFSAGLAALPREPFEAASIDGANTWQILRFLTIPLLKPLIFLTLIIRLMDAFKVFDQVFTLTQGGPGFSTHILSFVIYREGLTYKSFSYAFP